MSTLTAVGVTVLLAKRTKVGGCTLGSRPDRRCSPGAYYSRLTKAVICSPSFRTSSIRNVPESVKFAVDAGIFLVCLLSIAFRRPFTLQYALEAVDAQTAQYPGFISANYTITWAWVGAMVLMMAGNVLLLYVPGLPLWTGLLVAFAARNSAVYFTQWYPEYRKAKLTPPPANAVATH